MPPFLIGTAHRLAGVLLAAAWDVPDPVHPQMTMARAVDQYWFLVAVLVAIPLITLAAMWAAMERVPTAHRGAAARLLWLPLVPFCWPLAVWLLGSRQIPIALGEWANAEERRKNERLEAEWQARKDAAPDDPSIPPTPPTYTMPVGDCGKTIGLIWLLPAVGLLLGFLWSPLQYGFLPAYVLLAIIWFFAGRAAATLIERANPGDDRR